MTAPVTRYARADDGASIAYQVLGEGPDLVYVPGFVSHVEWAWELPPSARFLRRLASFSRLIVMDKRGTGLSDPIGARVSPEERANDIRAVMDSAGSERAMLFGSFEGGTLALLCAASNPERIDGLALYATPAKVTQGHGYPHGWSPAAIQLYLAASEEGWGAEDGASLLAPSLSDDSGYHQWFGRLLRMAASPGMAMTLLELNAQLDARKALPGLSVPVRILHRTGDRLVDVGHSRYLAEHVAGSLGRELDGDDHWPWAGDVDDLVAELAELVTGTRGLRDPDRVLTTLLFTDVVGSTELATDVGDRRLAELLDDHRILMRRELVRFGGHEVDSAGDGFLASFDGPTRAINCAAAVQEAVRTLGLDLRAGVHTGECEVLGERFGGIHVHIGARVAAAAGPGEIVVSSTVRDLVDGSAIVFDRRGTFELKGVRGARDLFTARVEGARQPVTIPER
ncbi:MAG: adenylate/guanylate cyclase domain-containing protein [Gaiellaceae bacterium]